MSGIEFGAMVRMAEMLAESTIVPTQYRKTGPDDTTAAANVLVVMFAGQDFGWSPPTAMRLMNVIKGSASLKPEAILGLARRAGHSITFEFRGPFDYNAHQGEVVARGRRCDTGDEAEATFSMADAHRASLSSTAWRQYPDDMCQWRAMSKLGRRLFGDLTLGASYSPEEIGGPDPTGAELAEARQAVVELEPPVEQIPALELAPPPNVDADTGEIVEAEAAETTPNVDTARLRAAAAPSPEPAPEAPPSVVIAVGDAKRKLLARVKDRFGLGEEEATEVAKELWQEHIGMGVAHLSQEEWQRLRDACDSREPF